jgi:acetolactate synthase-1/2/3 large subunit
MEMKAAEALVRLLQEEGVDVIFGYPGGAVLPLYDALYGQKIRHVLVRQEQGGAHAANGYARATGKIGVCIGTSGPGATNLVTGIANAFADSIPMLIITGQVHTQLVGSDAFQEVDITGITIPITKHNYLIKKAQDLPKVIKQAMLIASTGRPGPVLVDIPKDEQETLITYSNPKEVRPQGYKPTFKGNSKQIIQAAKAILTAERPLIFAGGGVIAAEASEELLKLAETIQAPVVNSLMSIGTFPRSHPLSLGMLGMHGAKYANLAVTECDVLIGLGVRFDDRATGKVSGFAPNAKIIHVDIDPAEVGKNVRFDIPIVGDVKVVIQELLNHLAATKHPVWLKRIEQLKVEYPLVLQAEKSCQWAQLHPWQVLQKLQQLTKGDAIVTTDVGQHQMWAAQHYLANRPRTFISSGGLGTMGYGFPAAVGAQLGCPDQQVICITGDGSFQMSMQEFGTAVEQKLPIKVIILNNHQLGMVRQLQEFYCEERYFGVDYTGAPDFAMFAQCYGATGLRITKLEELESVLIQALNTPGPVIVDCTVCGRENIYPMVLGGTSIDEAIVDRARGEKA